MIMKGPARMRAMNPKNIDRLLWFAAISNLSA